MKEQALLNHRSRSDDDLINKKKKQALAKSFCTRLDQACTRIQDLRTTYDQLKEQNTKKKKKTKGMNKTQSLINAK